MGYNAVMLAVHSDSPVDVIDFLLSKSISPVETDSLRGYDRCYRHLAELTNIAAGISIISCATTTPASFLSIASANSLATSMKRYSRNSRKAAPIR